MGGAASFVFLPPFQHDHHQSFMGRPSISPIYLSGVTLAVEVLGWTGLAIFSVARLFHLAEKLEQSGLIRDVSLHSLLATRLRKVLLDALRVSPVKICLCYVIVFVTSFDIDYSDGPSGQYCV